MHAKHSKQDLRNLSSAIALTAVMLAFTPDPARAQWSCAAPPCTTSTTGNIWYQNGSVGIGTSSPGQSLSVFSSAQRIAVFNSSHAWPASVAVNSTTGANASWVWQNNGATQWYLGNVSSDNSLRLLNSDANGNSTWVTFQQGGNVGIGTSTPGFVLALKPPTGSNQPQLYLQQENTDNGWLLFSDSSSGYLSLQRRGEGASPTNTTRMVITNTGSLGIGTSSPSFKLDLQGGQVNSSGGFCIGGTSCITAWPSSTANTWSGTQTFSTTTNFPIGIWNSSGNVGIGTTNPLTTLHVVAQGSSGPAVDAAIFTGSSPATTGVSQAIDLMNSSNTVGSTIGIGFRDGSTGGTSLPPGSAKVGAVFTDLTNHYGALVFQTRGADGLNERFRIDQFGNVGIGTTAPPYPLSVKGTIGAGEVIVINTSGWSDYVFDPNYRLSPLSEVNTYIQANHHLPGIPSAADVKQNGISVGDMQAKLLAKIEELTLHMIQQEKENQELRDRIARLEKSSASGTSTAPETRAK